MIHLFLIMFLLKLWIKNFDLYKYMTVYASFVCTNVTIMFILQCKYYKLKLCTLYKQKYFYILFIKFNYS